MTPTPSAGGTPGIGTPQGSRDQLTTLRTAVSWLFVPGDRPERIEKAFSTGADIVIVDLEDAVSANAKDHAREVARDLVERSDDARTARLVVRLNSSDSPWHAADLAALQHLPVTLMLPKAAPGDGLRRLCDRLAPVVGLIETARGCIGAVEVAGSVTRLAFGNADFGAELGVDPADQTALAHARAQLVLASAAAGLSAPVDGVTTALDDPEQARRDAEHALRMGFGGKLCVHPRQLAPVSAAFRPTQAQLTWARTILAAVQEADAAHAGVVRIAGVMVDAPVIARAQALLDRAH